MCVVCDAKAGINSVIFPSLEQCIIIIYSQWQRANIIDGQKENLAWVT